MSSEELEDTKLLDGGWLVYWLVINLLGYSKKN
jgi:hypothetical protein